MIRVSAIAHLSKVKKSGGRGMVQLGGEPIVMLLLDYVIWCCSSYTRHRAGLDVKSFTYMVEDEWRRLSNFWVALFFLFVGGCAANRLPMGLMRWNVLRGYGFCRSQGTYYTRCNEVGIEKRFELIECGLSWYFDVFFSKTFWSE